MRIAASQDGGKAFGESDAAAGERSGRTVKPLMT